MFFKDFDFSISEEESYEVLTEFTLNQLYWRKGLDAWNYIFVSKIDLHNLELFFILDHFQGFYDDSKDLHDIKKRAKVESIPTFRHVAHV